MSSNNSRVYANGYEKWEGERGRAMPAWLLIGQESLRNLVSSSGCAARLLFGSNFVIFYFLLFVVTLGHFQLEAFKGYDIVQAFSSMLEQSGLQVSEVQYHRNWIQYSSLIFTCLAMLFYGSQLISKDKRANAMQVYFSKAISRTDYFLGKFLAIGIVTATMTLVPSALILVMGVFLATDHVAFFQNSWYIPFLTGAYWLLITAVLGTLTLMFSSFFTKSYMAGVSIIGFLLFFQVFSMLMVNLVGAGDMIGGTSWFSSVTDIGDVIFDMEVTNWSKTIWQVIDLSVLVTVCTALIFRNIRPVEVVS